MRLIDAETAKKELARFVGYLDEDTILRLQIALDRLPAVDAVPVVRCKDCKHRDAEEGFCEGRGWPMQLVPDGGFCNKGERSEE